MGSSVLHLYLHSDVQNPEAFATDGEELASETAVESAELAGSNLAPAAAVG
jgi:hypothetical protein